MQISQLLDMIERQTFFCLKFEKREILVGRRVRVRIGVKACVSRLKRESWQPCVCVSQIKIVKTPHPTETYHVKSPTLLHLPLPQEKILIGA